MMNMADKKSREVKKGRAKFKCLVCDHKELMEVKKGTEVMPCPKCNGAFVDVWYMHKYKKRPNPPKSYTSKLGDSLSDVGEITAKLSIDCSDALTGLKAVQREARKATRSLKELEEQQKKVHYGVDIACGKDMTITNKYCKGCNRHEQYCVCSDDNE